MDRTDFLFDDVYFRGDFFDFEACLRTLDAMTVTEELMSSDLTVYSYQAADSARQGLGSERYSVVLDRETVTPTGIGRMLRFCSEGRDPVEDMLIDEIGYGTHMFFLTDRGYMTLSADALSDLMRILGMSGKALDKGTLMRDAYIADRLYLRKRKMWAVTRHVPDILYRKCVCISDSPIERLPYTALTDTARKIRRTDPAWRFGDCEICDEHARLGMSRPGKDIVLELRHTQRASARDALQVCLRYTLSSDCRILMASGSDVLTMRAA